jgi:hypothetical protein
LEGPEYGNEHLKPKAHQPVVASSAESCIVPEHVILVRHTAKEARVEQPALLSGNLIGKDLPVKLEEVKPQKVNLMRKDLEESHIPKTSKVPSNQIRLLDEGELVVSIEKNGEVNSCSQGGPKSEEYLLMQYDVTENAATEIREGPALKESQYHEDLGGTETESELEEYSSMNEESREDVQQQWLEIITAHKPASMHDAFEILKRALIEKAMSDIWVMYDRRWTAKVNSYTGNTGRSSSNSASTGNTTTSSASHMAPSRSRKRSRGGGEGSTSDADGNDSQSSRSNSRTRKHPDPGLKLACPFRKHDPLKYNLQKYSICALSSWSTIARVKYV